MVFQVIDTRSLHSKTFAAMMKKSKETYMYGQTRGLSNLEMKHVGKLAIIGALLKAVKTSCVRTMQSRTYLLCCTHIIK